MDGYIHRHGAAPWWCNTRDKRGFPLSLPYTRRSKNSKLFVKVRAHRTSQCNTLSTDRFDCHRKSQNNAFRSLTHSLLLLLQEFNLSACNNNNNKSSLTVCEPKRPDDGEVDGDDDGDGDDDDDHHDDDDDNGCGGGGGCGCGSSPLPFIHLVATLGLLATALTLFLVHLRGEREKT